MQEYTTIANTALTEFTEKRSRFIGAIAPVQNEEQALAFIQEKKSRYWDAAHHVYAYILREGQTRRYSDDGEPQGTAGMPALETLQKEGLTDVVVVATRYFGGILLGAGGLVRAYAHTAKIAVDAATRRVMSPCAVLEMDLGYDLYGKLSHLLPRFGAHTLHADFGAVVRLRVLLLEQAVTAFEKELAEQTSALITPRLLEVRYDCMDAPGAISE